MTGNRVKQRLQNGGVATIAGNFDTADMIDFVGALGLFDAVWIEMEHGPVTWSQLSDLSRAAEVRNLASVVRVRDNDSTLISLTLGEGIDGVIVPHVNTREEAERVVDAALFGPLGHRGVGGGRKSYGRPGYYTGANAETFIAVMIEDIEAVENLREILRVPHIDVFFVGKFDLAQSLGLLHDPGNPRVREVYDQAITQIAAAGRVPGSALGEQDFGKYLGMGVRFVKVPIWRSWVSGGAKAYAEHFAEAVGRLG
jgi:4-hydroxy-2-oxoheptanedioate aldolase